ncbi:MAG TPA: M48 family metallopeptidase [Myxococcota bacterium]|nr:M48 family metallopeptidase [Myxococcota bacterium]
MRYEAKLPDDSVNVSAGSPLGEAVWLLAGVAGLVLALTFAVALAIEALVPFVPPSAEVRLFGALGEHLAEELHAGEGADARTARVQGVLDRLAARWTDSPYPGFHARIVEEPAPNAFAFPGGAIVVTSGLLDRVENENELAFVLAHELGHFAGRDHLRGIGRGIAVGSVLALLGIGAEQADGLVGALGTLSSRGFDRRQESDADAFGLGLLVAEYGHAAGVREVFERVLVAGADGGSGDEDEVGSDVETEDEDDSDEHHDVSKPDDASLSGYWSTHPPSTERTRRLEARIAESGWSAEGETTDWE